MSKTHKYSSLEEATNAIDEKNWPDNPEEIEDNEENRQIVEDGLFWCAVESVRFTYTRESLYAFMEGLTCIKDLWKSKEVANG